MRHLTALIGFAFLCAAPAFAQPVEEWVARHNGSADSYDLAEAITLDDLGNIYVTGRSTYLGEDYDIVTIKYDPDGNEVWLARYTGPTHQYDGANDICVDADYNVYITGSCDAGFFGGDWLTIKYAPDGTLAWKQVYPGGSGSAVAVDGAGNVIVTGSVSYPSDITTIKYGPNGARIWIRFYDGPLGGNDHGRDLAVDAGGNIFVTGDVAANPGAFVYADYATIKYMPDGTLDWDATYDAAGYADTPNEILLDDGGAVYVLGSSALTSETNSDILLVKYSPLGAYVWGSRYDYGGSSDFGNHVARDPDGNIFAAGSSMIPGMPGHYDYTTIKFDPADGSQLWVRQYDGPGNKWDMAYGIAVDSEGKAYVAGRSQGDAPDNNYDYATVAYDADGTELWVMRYDGPANDADYGDGGVVVDADFNVYVTGNSTDVATGADYATIKYSSYHILLRRGNVNVGAGEAADVLFFNGSAGDWQRKMTVPPGTQVTMTMDVPPAGPNPAAFCLYAWPAEAGPGDPAEQPFGIGTACFPMPLSNGTINPPPYTVINNIGFYRVLGMPVLSGVAPAPVTIGPGTLPAGTYTFQGLIFDSTAGGLGVSLSNAVVVEVQ